MGFLAIVLMLGVVVLLWRSYRSIPSDKAAWQNFEQHYGTVEALMVLGGLDLNKLKSQRDQGRLQRWDAIRDVMAQANVPEQIATELIDRL